MILGIGMMTKAESSKRRRMRTDRLRQIRKARNLTQQDIVDRTGISISQYRRYETDGADHSDPSFDVVIKLAKVLECSIDWLAGLSNDIKGHISEEDLTTDQRRVLMALRSFKDPAQKFQDAVLALTQSEELFGDREE